MPRRTLKPSAHVLWPSKATEDYAHWSHMQSSLLSLYPYGMWLLRDVPHGAVPMHEKGLTTPPSNSAVPLRYSCNCRTWHNICSLSFGLRGVMPRIIAHWEIWLQSWFFTMNPSSSNKLMVDGLSPSPRPKVMCAGATLWAWMNDQGLPVTIVHQKTSLERSPLEINVCIGWSGPSRHKRRTHQGRQHEM